MRPTRTALLIAATALTPSLLFTAPAFAAAPTTTTVAVVSSDTPVDQMTEDELRAAIQEILADKDSGTAVVREANEALAGTVDDMRAFLETGYTQAQVQDDALAVATILGKATANGDMHVARAASDALDANTAEALREFLQTGYAQAQVQDDALWVATILGKATAAGDMHVKQAANDALDANTAQALRDFRETGYRLAQAQDDALYIVRMLNDPNLSDAVNAAIQAVLNDGSPEAMRYFRTVGQYEVDG